MYVVRFSPMRYVEYHDVDFFESRAGKWLSIREAENCNIIGNLPSLRQRAMNNSGRMMDRLCTVEEGDAVVGAAVLFAQGGLITSWLSHDMMDVLADGLFKARASINSIFAPAHVSWQFAERWAEATGARFEFGRSERLFQLARPAHELSPTGRLSLATRDDMPTLMRWMEGFMRDAEYESGGQPVANVCQHLVNNQALYIWRDPHPVSMAAWIMPTPNGGCINFVYVPAEFRGKGHGKAVVTALAKHMISNGRKYCFILTDNEDKRTNNLYQSIGGRTLCEFMRCTITPKEPSFGISLAHTVPLLAATLAIR